MYTTKLGLKIWKKQIKGAYITYLSRQTLTSLCYIKHSRHVFHTTANFPPPRRSHARITNHTHICYVTPFPKVSPFFLRAMSTRRGNKTASETYQRVSQLEHVLLRPDTYVGSIEFHEVPMWVCDADGNAVNKVVKIVPGLYKIFDEVLVNAADNKVNDPSMKCIKVDINVGEKTISVMNDGKGIPIEMHSKEKMYVPQLIFGNLLTSSNYDDEEQKVTGGRNGYGAKLCNIYSKEFILETADNRRLYRQVWTNNMNDCAEPTITTNTTKKSFTKITFTPDLARFGMSEFDDDFVSVLRRRVYDMAGTVKGIQVYLNGEPVPIKGFKAYVDLFVKSLSQNENASGKILYATPNDRWEIAFALSDGNGFQQISFVNSIATTSGGTHVDHVADQISKYAIEQIGKTQKLGKLQKAQVRNHMFVFVNCKITNPSFSSQTKEQLSTKVSAFGSKCDLSDKFLKDCLKSTGLEDRLISLSEENADKQMKKQDGGKRKRMTEYAKLLDAKKAGDKREAHKCTLILTEGDSALGLAKEGLKEVGYEYFGCFPLRGKILNVRDAPYEHVMRNAEIKALKQIIGLQHKKSYDSVQGLRYGHVMMMTDQDHDGSHIKGLLINFFESSFPGLLNVPGFLREFITPIIKVTIESGRDKGEEIAFYSMPQYEEWRENVAPTISKWRIKYYKGLGTSTPLEMKEYFSDIDTHRKTFQELQDGDDKCIDLVFSKTKAEDRKQWLQGYQPGTFLDHSANVIPIQDFINKELILFSMADNLRSIPSVIDGFKPGQRKIMWVALGKKKSEIKVQSLAGDVISIANYHHGDASLTQTIIGLAQDFVGANNLYFLMPIGGFGTRDQGGKDASAGRYISTRPSDITRAVFMKDDEPLLNYLQEDEFTVEPEYYVPVLPTVLINGADGIGTGWSTNIPSYNPLDIVNNLKKLINGEPMVPMVPWYRGWTGKIEKIPGSEHQWRVCGRIEEIDDNTLAITELPVKTWTMSMKEFLLKSEKGAHKASTEKDKDKLAANEFIDDMWEEHTDYIRFIVKLSSEEMDKAKQVGLYKKFRLITNLNTGNMVAFDPQGRLRRYGSPQEIIQEFYHVRLDFYQKRHDYMITELRHDLERISQRARFIKLIIENELVVSNKKRKILEKELSDLKFPMFVGNMGKPIWPDELSPDVKEEISNANNTDDNEANDEESEDTGIRKKKVASYDYLLNMHIASLTMERYQRLLRERGDSEDKLQALLNTGIKDMWVTELDRFVEKWEQFMAEDTERRLSSGNGGKKKTKKNAKRKAADDDDEFGQKAPRKRRQVEKKQPQQPRSYVVPLPPIEDAVKAPPKTRVKSEPASKDTTPKPKGRAKATKASPRLKVEPQDPTESNSSETTEADSKSTTTASETPTIKSPVKPLSKAQKNKLLADEADMSVDDEPLVRTPPKRTRRAAAAKIVVDDESSGPEVEKEEKDDIFHLSD